MMLVGVSIVDLVILIVVFGMCLISCLNRLWLSLSVFRLCVFMLIRGVLRLIVVLSLLVECVLMSGVMFSLVMKLNRFCRMIGLMFVMMSRIRLVLVVWVFSIW